MDHTRKECFDMMSLTIEKTRWFALVPISHVRPPSLCSVALFKRFNHGSFF